MDENNCIDAQSKHTLSFTRDNGTKRKQTEADPTTPHDRKKTSRYYIKNDSTFNGTALSPNELTILWNKFKMHGHFKVEEDSQNIYDNDKRDLLTGQVYHHINNNKSDQSDLLSTTTNNKLIINDNNNIYNGALAFETSINNKVVGGEINKLESIVHDTYVNMYQEIPSYQFSDQYINNLYYPIDGHNNQTNTSNVTMHNHVESLINQVENKNFNYF